MLFLVQKILVDYFTMEVGIRSDIPIYSGGLGILSGDIFKSATDMGIPLRVISNLYDHGYFTQKIKDKQQVEIYEPYDPEQHMKKLEERVSVPIEGREVKVKAWLYEHEGITGFKNPALLLSTRCPGNPFWDERISDTLYREEPNDRRYARICQEMVLGIGGVKMIHELNGKHSLSQVLHLNEGHGAFATLEMLKRYGMKAAKEQTVFTTHTPIEAGHDRFEYDKIYSMMGDYLKGIDIKALAGDDKLNMTLLALNMSRYANAVSKTHQVVSGHMFPNHNINSVTNGVHSYTWTSPEFQALYDKHIPEWRQDPCALIHADKILSSELLAAHGKAKQRLIDYVNSYSDARFDPNLVTFGFARRFADYKRGDLMFYDLHKLVDICKGKAQIVFAGKAHPRDGRGKQIINNVLRFSENLRGKVNIAFLENYNLDVGKLMASGCDVWVNLPRRPYEASGTSGMKAAHNGVPTLSTLEGWVAETSITGEKRQGVWAVGPEPEESNLWKSNDLEDAISLYKVMKEKTIPACENDELYAKEMIEAIKNAAWTNTHRVVRELMEKAYQLK
jgi:starch phosphorylase